MFYQPFLWLSPMVSLVAAGQHGQDSVADRYPRRHHHRLSLSQRQEPAPECQPGQFRCSGTELQQCVSEAWLTIQHCDGEGLYCAADIASCMWKTENASGVITPSSVVPTSANGDSASAASTGGVGAVKAVVPTGTPGAGDHGDRAGQWGQGNQGGHGNQGGQGNQGDQSQSSSTISSDTAVNPASTNPAPSGTEIDQDSQSTSSSGNAASTSSPAVAGGGTKGESYSRKTAQAPHNVVYGSYDMKEMPKASELGPINRLILAFWMSGGRGAVDAGDLWAKLDAGARKTLLDSYHEAGVALMVSAFGGTDENVLANEPSPEACATRLSEWVKEFELDGVDIDFEELEAMNFGTAEAWLISFQKKLREELPADRYLISHAPLAPWFTSSTKYPNKAYRAIHKEVGEGIDFYNLQFFNQVENYQSCQTLITESGTMYPGSSALEINAAGVPMDKIVVGKPVGPWAAGSGIMPMGELSGCLGEARTKGWTGGVMLWRWHAGAPQNMTEALGSGSA